MSSTSPSKTLYAVTVGKTPEAVVSCLWAYVERYGPPSAVLFIASGETSRLCGVLSRCVEALAPGAGVEVLEVDEAEVGEAVPAIAEALRRYRAEGYSVRVDVTPGRKTMSIALYTAAIEAGADLILYLHLREPRFTGTLLPYIPRHFARLVVLRGGAEG